MLKLTGRKQEKQNRIFIPSEYEMEAICFLNSLQEMSYQFIPDENELILDFDILKDQKSMISDELEVIYDGEKYTMEAFINMFEEEVSFYLILE